MKTRIPRRYYFIPAFYVIIIGSLLYFEFSGTVRILDSVHGMELTAVLPARIEGRGSAIESVAVDVDGLIFRFDRQNPLEMRTDGGRSTFASVSGYTITPGSIEISFGDSLQIIFFSNGTDNRRIEIISAYDETLELVIPFLKSPSSHVETLYNAPFLSIKDVDDDSAESVGVAFPASAKIDLNQGHLIFQGQSGAFETVHIGKIGETVADRIQFWITAQYDFPHEQEYGRRMVEFIDAAYSGWTGSRFNRRNGTWRMPDGVSKFDEQLLTSALAESVKRGTYQQVFALFEDATILYHDKTTWLSSPFIGDIVNKVRAIEQQDLDQIQKISSLISDNRLEVFAIPHLLDIAVDRAPYAVIQGLADLASRLDFSGASLKDAIGLLSTYISSLSMDFEYAEAFSEFRIIVENKIVPLLILTDYGLLLQTNGKADVLTGIRAGTLLKMLGEIEANPLVTAIGKELVSGILAFQDEEGFLPSTININGASVEGTSGKTRPEELYQTLADAAFFPHHVSLSSELGQGTWMWTMGDGVSVERSGTNVYLTFTVTNGSTHHFMIRGLEPFSNIRMFDIPWKSDPRFQYYTSGWLYDTQTGTLFVKITHKADSEQLLISY